MCDNTLANIVSVEYNLNGQRVERIAIGKEKLKFTHQVHISINKFLL